jgi:hypothetical protein
MKTSEFGAFWAKGEAANMRRQAARLRGAYRTPLMTEQTYPVADACDQAAALFDAVAERLNNRANVEEPISPPTKAVAPQPRNVRFDG